MILEVKDLTKEYTVETGVFTRPHTVRALDGVSFGIEAFETLGVVGESGSGKTTLAKVILGLVPASSGKVVFDSEAIGRLRKDVQIIFQNPFASLDPRMRILDSVAEPLIIHRLAAGKAARRRAGDLLAAVGIDSSGFMRYPSQFSGGQRQRICIARALAQEPKLLVLDEPVSSLDLTVQLGLLDLLKGIKKKFNLTYMFISHSLGVIRYMSDSVMVMREGRIVEKDAARRLFEAPGEEYTKSLIRGMESD